MFSRNDGLDVAVVGCGLEGREGLSLCSAPNIAIMTTNNQQKAITLDRVLLPDLSVNHEKNSGAKKMPIPSKIPTGLFCGLPQSGHTVASEEISFPHSEQ